MYATGNLIPAKFLLLIAHLTIVSTILWSSQQSVTICLPENLSQNVLNQQHVQLVAGLSMTLGFIAFELILFLTGLTMFNTSSALYSIGCHGSACVTLSYVISDSWKCVWYWWIFAFCSALPALSDLFILSDVIINKKY